MLDHTLSLDSEHVSTEELRGGRCEDLWYTLPREMDNYVLQKVKLQNARRLSMKGIVVDMQQ